MKSQTSCGFKACHADLSFTDSGNRFKNKEIHLRGAVYWDIGTKKTAKEIVRDGGGIICNLKYIGISCPDGLDKDYPEYEGVIYFSMYDGRRIAFNFDPDSQRFEHINPVRVWPLDEKRVVVHTASDDPLLIDTERAIDIKTVKLVSSRISEKNKSTYKRYKDPDYFEFELLPERSRG